MSETIENLYDELSKLTVLEVADLVKRLEEGWGVSAAAAVRRAPRPPLPPLPVRSKSRPSST